MTRRPTIAPMRPRQYAAPRPLQRRNGVRPAVTARGRAMAERSVRG